MYNKTYRSHISLGYLDIALSWLNKINSDIQIFEKRENIWGNTEKQKNIIKRFRRLIIDVTQDFKIADETLILSCLYNIRHAIELFSKEIAPNWWHDIDNLIKSTYLVLSKVSSNQIKLSIVNYEKIIKKKNREPKTSKRTNWKYLNNEVNLILLKDIWYYKGGDITKTLTKMKKIVDKFIKIAPFDKKNTFFRYFEDEIKLKWVINKYDNKKKIEKTIKDILFLKSLFKKIIFGKYFLDNFNKI